MHPILTPYGSLELTFLGQKVCLDSRKQVVQQAWVICKISLELLKWPRRSFRHRSLIAFFRFLG